MNDMKPCIWCGVQTEESNFPKTTYIKKNGEHGKRSYCKPCELLYRKVDYKKRRVTIRDRAKHRYKTNPIYRKKCRDGSLKYLYGLSIETFESLKKQQNYCCAICGIHESEALKKRLFVDHDHEDGKVRGLLCHLCNLGLGAFGDSIKKIGLGIDYLNKHKK